MASAEDEVNPYELIGITSEATDAEIKTAYRQRSLKVHPDRNRGNPDAARKFHELNQAYELLLDPLRRLALDAKLRAAEARKKRTEKYDTKRKHLLQELEERERAFKKSKLERDATERTRAQEAERIKDEGRRLREEREKELKLKEEEAEKAAAIARAELEPPTIGHLDTTVRLKYPLGSHHDLTTPDAIATYLTQFGPTDASSIVLSMKPPKKAPHKPPKNATVLVPFQRIGDAHAAVCASGLSSRGMGDVEITWAGGSEPAIIAWLKKMGKLGQQQESDSSPAGEGRDSSPALPQQRTSASGASGLYSTFPTSFPDLSSRQAPDAPTGLDYEALTMMRLRQAERERLEREIMEQEAESG